MSNNTQGLFEDCRNGDDSIRLNMQLIGQMTIFDTSGALIKLAGRKARAVLAFLALSSGPVLRDTLVAHLWSRAHREQGRSSLRQSVYEIQDAFGESSELLLKSEKHYLQLRLASVRCDVQEVRKATAMRPDGIRLLTAGLLEDLYGIDPKFDEWLQTERRCISAYANAIAAAVLNDSTNPANLIVASQHVLRGDTTSLDAWRALIDAYTTLGQIEAAAAAYNQCRLALNISSGNVLGYNNTASTIDSESVSDSSAAWEDLSTKHKKNVSTNLIKIGVMNIRALDDKSKCFASGLTEEITSAFLRFRGITCLSSLSLLIDSSNMALFRKSRANFVIDGSVQSSRVGTRVTIHLVDVFNHGEIVWSQKFDLKVEDVLDAQTSVAALVVAQIDPELIVRTVQQIETIPTERSSSVQLVLRAIPAISRLERKSFSEAGKMLSTAVDQDPDNGAAHAWLAYWNLLLLGQGWANHPADTEKLTWELAKRAIALDPGDARALTLAGHVQAFTHRRLDEAMTLHERALSINPSLPIAWLFLGLANTYAGHHDEAIRHIRHAKRLSPLDPHAFFFDMGLTLSLSLSGNDYEAIEYGRNAAEINPSFSSTFKAYLSALGFVGDPVTRSMTLRHLLSLEPEFSISSAVQRSPLNRVEDRKKFSEGLRRSGLSE